jgi:hypothetical protein
VYRPPQDRGGDCKPSDEKGFHCLLSGLSRELQNFPAFAAGDAGDVIGPNSQSVFYFAGVGAAIVDASNTGLVATDMVQHSFDDVRLHANVGHASCCCSAQIMQPPGRNLATLIQSYFCLMPIIETASAGAKQAIAVTVRLFFL